MNYICTIVVSLLGGVGARDCSGTVQYVIFITKSYYTSIKGNVLKYTKNIFLSSKTNKQFLLDSSINTDTVKGVVLVFASTSDLILYKSKKNLEPVRRLSF